MLVQQAMIERLRRLCQQDERLVAAMLYGSFLNMEGDEFSDIECVLFFADDALEDIEPQRWVSQIAPVDLYFTNDFGVGTAIFENLVRGEFHFEKASDMKMVETWKDSLWLPSVASALLVDRTSELSEYLQVLVGPPPSRGTPEHVQSLTNSFINWILFGANVLARGEAARALELLWWVQRYLLWLVRLEGGTTEHWSTPTKALEQDISTSDYARYVACTSKLDKPALWQAYLAAWRWGKGLIKALASRHESDLSRPLLEKLERHLLENADV